MAKKVVRSPSACVLVPYATCKRRTHAHVSDTRFDCRRVGRTLGGNYRLASAEAVGAAPWQLTQRQSPAWSDNSGHRSARPSRRRLASPRRPIPRFSPVAAHHTQRSIHCEQSPNRAIGCTSHASRDLECIYSNRGMSDEYMGRISSLGVDIGYHGAGKLAWAVIAATPDVPQGAWPEPILG